VGVMKTFELVYPTMSRVGHLSSSVDKYQAARKLASEAFRTHFKAQGVDHFHIVIHEMLSREKIQVIEACGLTDGDPKFFTAYGVHIKTDTGSFSRGGRMVEPGFRSTIFSLKHEEKADYIKKGVSLYNARKRYNIIHFVYKSFVFVVKFLCSSSGTAPRCRQHPPRGMPFVFCGNAFLH
jgi:hypothetical protein